MSFDFWVQTLGVSSLERNMPLSHAKENLLIMPTGIFVDANQNAASNQRGKGSISAHWDRVTIFMPVGIFPLARNKSLHSQIRSLVLDIPKAYDHKN